MKNIRCIFRKGMLMKFYCEETEAEFIFCVENAEGKIYDNLQSDPYWKKTDATKFIKVYPTDTNWDDAWYLNQAYKEAVISNFERLGQAWIEGVFDWKKVLSVLARLFQENKIEWYIIGSASEAVLGVNIIPHDLDITVHTRDFYKVKELTREYVIEPLSDNKGNWIVRYFGKLCVDGASVDIAADDTLNRENNHQHYEKAIWNGYEVYVTPLRERYEVEIQRDRKDRIKAIAEYMNGHK